jgi:exodeoxyribonuclease VII small subunit
MTDIKYSKAMLKLEEIIKDIENEEVDIDDLSQKVKEAVSLVRTCKDKISKAEVEVKEVVAGFDGEEKAS